jgi:hypothetical protein
LEVLVHFKQRQLPDDYVAVTILIPDSIGVMSGSPFEAKNAGSPYPVWVMASVIIAREKNIILYPEAPGFRAQIIDLESFRFDPRLIEGRSAPA